MSNNGQSAKRASFSGKIGYVLAVAGSAVGLGNIWRFPYMVSDWGGMTFLIPYILFVILIASTGVIEREMLSELIIKYYDNLNQNDLYLCQFIGEHKKECVDMTIEEMAEKSHISRSSILRFAKKLSLKGYSELKVYLKMDVQREQLPERDVLAEVCDDYHRNGFIRKTH